MNTQKTYYAPSLQAMTGLPHQTDSLRFEFEFERCCYGVCSLDATLPLPMGGVSVLYETDDFVMAKDFVSSRAS